MTPAHNDSATGRTTPTTVWRWTPRRAKLAGFCGVLGGFIGLLIPVLVGRGLEFGGDPGVGGVIHLLSYGLVATTVLAANAWYRDSYGRGGRVVAGLLAMALLGYTASTTAFVVVPSLGELFFPLGWLTGTAYLATWLFGSWYGFVLWNHTNGNRLTAGLFVSLFPSLFVLGMLIQVGFPEIWIETPIWLAFIALGAELWRTDDDTVRTRVDTT